jgi:hypothetical protein
MKLEEIKELSNMALDAALYNSLPEVAQTEIEHVNFSTSLDDCQAAEAYLTGKQWAMYLRECLLFSVQCRQFCEDEFGSITSLQAYCNLCGAFCFGVLTARQRAEALLYALANEPSAVDYLKNLFNSLV